jgi:hypothetical protein
MHVFHPCRHRIAQAAASFSSNKSQNFVLRNINRCSLAWSLTELNMEPGSANPKTTSKACTLKPFQAHSVAPEEFSN